MKESTRKMIEEKAKELFSVAYENPEWADLSDENKISFELVAKHVLASELKARIHEWKNYPEDEAITPKQQLRINELTEQLNEITGQ